MRFVPVPISNWGFRMSLCSEQFWFVTNAFYDIHESMICMSSSISSDKMFLLKGQILCVAYTVNVMLIYVTIWCRTMCCDTATRCFSLNTFLPSIAYSIVPSLYKFIRALLEALCHDSHYTIILLWNLRWPTVSDIFKALLLRILLFQLVKSLVFFPSSDGGKSPQILDSPKIAV